MGDASGGFPASPLDCQIGRPAKSAIRASLASDCSAYHIPEAPRVRWQSEHDSARQTSDCLPSLAASLAQVITPTASDNHTISGPIPGCDLSLPLCQFWSPDGLTSPHWPKQTTWPSVDLWGGHYVLAIIRWSCKGDLETDLGPNHDRLHDHKVSMKEQSRQRPEKLTPQSQKG